jgi:carbamoyl-phosphate synthase small subunit
LNTDSHRSAILVLQDGTIFKGRSIGAEGLSSGEVVFNTSMTGYQEILTDPSYARQIITFTHPHIGNTGTNTEDEESSRIWAAGLVIRDLPALASNFRSQQSLDVYLKEKNILGISDIDTRKLTRILREKGAQSGCLMAGDIDEGVALQVARDFSGLEGVDLAKEVTTTTVFKWTEGSWKLGFGHQQSKHSLYKVVAYDFGVKRNILRMLVDRGADLTVVPAQTSAAEVLEMNPDGIFLSNGPGDPQPCTYAVDSIREILKTDIPIFGICLGHQLLALASGAKTMKMKFGHHGANHPVKDIGAGKVMITSQNHGFSVDEKSLPSTLRATHYSLFDGSIQGIHRTDKPAFGFQGHPEASPGPHEASLLFDHFFELISYAKKN